MRRAITTPGKSGLKIAGYTLIEFSIVIVVAGLITAAFASSWDLYRKTQAEQTTDTNISGVTAALTQYLTAYGAYPCPARLNALRTDPDYGVSGQCDANNHSGVSVTNPAGPYVAIPAGTYANGYYEQTSDRLQCPAPPCSAALPLPGALPTGGWAMALTGNPPLPATPYGPLIRRGMVPFRTLGIPETGLSSAMDGYNMRLQYAVTEALAVPGTYRADGGGIDVEDDLGHSQTSPIPLTTATTTPVQTAYGAVHYIIISSGADRAGGYTLDGAQGTPCSTVAYDGANCATSLLGIYRVGPFSTASGANHNDDHMKYYSNVQSVLWRVATPIGQNITDLINAGNGGSGLIGVGGIPVTGGAALQVTGNALAEGSLKTNNLCPPGTSTSTLCTPAALTSTCPPGSYATGIKQGSLTPMCNSNVEVDCPPGQVAIGINTTTNQVQCGARQGCAAAPITLCTPPSVTTADVRLLPSVLSGVTWNNAGSNNGGVSGASYWEGWQCNGTVWSRQSQNGVCACAAGSSSTNPLCTTYYGTGTGTYTGNVILTSTTACPSGVTTQTADTSGCQCTPSSQTRSRSCPSPETGGPLTQTNDWTCPTGASGQGTWGSWNTTAGTCSCNPAATQGPVNTPCPSGYSNGTYPQTSTMQCPAGTWGPWLPASPTPAQCPCTPQTVTNTLGCVAPLTGSGMIYHQQWTCSPSPTLSPAYPGTLYINNCGTTTYTWQPVGTPTTGYPSALSYSLYTTCTTQGQTVSCSTPDGTTYDHYNNNGCQCE